MMKGNARHRIMRVLTALCAISFVSGCATDPVMVANPDYQAWARLLPGSYVTIEGTEVTGGRQQPIRMKERLVAKDAQRVVLERTIEYPGAKEKRKPQRTARIESAKIDPADHPLTHPDARIKDLGTQELKIAGKTFTCQVREVAVRTKLDSFVLEEQEITIKVYRCTRIPGAMAKAHLRSRTPEHTYEVSGQVVDYKAVWEKED